MDLNCPGPHTHTSGSTDPPFFLHASAAVPRRPSFTHTHTHTHTHRARLTSFQPPPPPHASAAVPRRPSFTPSVDLLSLGLGCEWAEPVVWQQQDEEEEEEGEEEAASGDGKGLQPPRRQRRREAGGAAIRVAISARSLRCAGFCNPNAGRVRGGRWSVASGHEWTGPIVSPLSSFFPPPFVRSFVRGTPPSRPGGVLRVSWVDSRFFDGRGLTTATLSVPIVRASCVRVCVRGGGGGWQAAVGMG